MYALQLLTLFKCASTDLFHALGEDNIFETAFLEATFANFLQLAIFRYNYLLQFPAIAKRAFTDFCHACWERDTLDLTAFEPVISNSFDTIWDDNVLHHTQVLKTHAPGERYREEDHLS